MRTVGPGYQPGQLTKEIKEALWQKKEKKELIIKEKKDFIIM